MMKTIAVLGVVSTIFAASATPTLARTVHHRADSAYAAAPFLMQEPNGFRHNRGWGRQAPRATVRPSVSWDRYGMRWDGGS
jgi:hypothetical protein